MEIARLAGELNQHMCMDSTRPKIVVLQMARRDRNRNCA